MKKFLKWFGIILGSLLGLIVLAFLGLALRGNSMLNKKYDVQAETITIPTDAAAIARGEHWVKASTSQCIGCHGVDLSGGTFIEAPFATIDAKNLTSGKGGAGSEFKDEDWIRALRHGVNPEGYSLIMIHASDFSDADLGDIIAYVKSVPPVDKETREPKFNLLGKAMVGTGAIEKFIGMYFLAMLLLGL